MRHLRRSRGQGMVEFALVSPLLFLMLFGLMEGGWLLFHNHQVSNAAREGARFAIVNGNMSGSPTNSNEVRAHVEDRVRLSNWDSFTLTMAQVDGDMEPGDRIRIDVSYTHETLVGFIFPSASINLSSSSQMRVHY